MSGICGVWAFDGGEPELAPVLTLLERRGPDGTNAWRDGPVALGHTSLATTPEALVEVLPLTDQGSGCTITADARIDNRDDLIAALELDGETRTIGDGELILRAYLEWGEACPVQLLGDFAFAIWDPREQRLFCARDHMGMRQFNYSYVPNKHFLFATEDTALLAHDRLPKSLNQGRIADFIDDLEGFDFTSTFFNHIIRLPPAHSLTIDLQGCRIRRFWKLRPGTRLRLESDHAYSAAFLQIFTAAVCCRLRNGGSLGAMLSGGLDSTAVVTIASGLLSASNKGPLKTISAVSSDDSLCPETIAIRSALTIDGLDPILIGQIDFDRMLKVLISEMDEVRNPFEVHGTMLRSIYLTAQENRINIVLDGGAGDVILTSDNRIAFLLSQRSLKRALQEIDGEIVFWKPNNPLKFRVHKLLSAAWVAFAPLKIRSRWRRFRLSKPLPGAQPRFAEHVNFAQRRQSADGHIRMDVAGETARRTQSILHPNLVSGRERYDQLAGSFGVESRDPFMDIRVIQFCLSLPPEQLQAGGWPKIILRRALETQVPHDIAWRQGKEHLGWTFTTKLLASWGDWQDAMRDPHSPLKDFLSSNALRDLREHRNDPPTGLRMRLFALDRFLRRYGNPERGH